MRTVLLVRVVLVLGAPSAVAAQSRATQLVNSAFAQVRAGHLDSAEAFLTPVLDSSVHPSPTERAEALFLHGVLQFVRSGDSMAAAPSFREALALRLDLAGDWLLGLDSSVGRVWRRTRGQAICGTAMAVVPDLLDKPSALTSLTQSPKILSAPRLYFPSEQVRHVNWRGRVMAAAVIDTAGRVEPGTVKILRSPDSDFSREVRNWILKVSFQPARTEEGPVRACIEVPVDFRLGH